MVATGGWTPIESGARQAGLAAYDRNRSEAAEAWLLLAEWARWLGTNQRTAVASWIDAINTAKLGHSGLVQDYTAADAPLAQLLRVEFGEWLLANRDFSRMFFETVAPTDSPIEVLRILDRLHASDPRRFARQPALALAIAVVYDAPPPPGWPHAQVSAQALPRQLADPRAAFDYWAQADERGLTLQRLSRLSPVELKFVVDASAPRAELDWARQSMQAPLERLALAYDAIRYRNDRVTANAMIWTGAPYTLPAILAQGGICVDQAYFASQVGKALGVPTLMFRGAGLDGRHAWFGYLDGRQQWQLDVGRYADQRYVAGVAFDPQTWGNVGDHELAFLSEGFRRLPSWRQSQLAASVAESLLRVGRRPEAVTMARRSLQYERRNLRAWSVLGLALRETGAEPRVREAALREGIQAFQRYPDLHVEFTQQLVAVLRERGETSAAANEERLLAQRHQAARIDLSVKQAAERVSAAMRNPPGGEQLQVYTMMLEQYGPGAPVEFFDRVVKPFAQHLNATGRRDEARRAVERARAVLEPPPGSQLDRETAALARFLR